ncbi:MAG: transposase [Rhodospirillales bacterium]|nr:transposase [Rhodospirillales bacterium]
MAQFHSMDLRERVVAVVELGRMPCNQPVCHFDVAISTPITWMRRLWETGSVASGQMGGHKPKKLVGAHRDWLCSAAPARTSPCRRLVAECADRGLLADCRSV